MSRTEKPDNSQCCGAKLVSLCRQEVRGADEVYICTSCGNTYKKPGRGTSLKNNKRKISEMIWAGDLVDICEVDGKLQVFGPGGDRVRPEIEREVLILFAEFKKV